MKLSEYQLLQITLSLLKTYHGYKAITPKQFKKATKAALAVAKSLGYDVSEFERKKQ